MTGRPPIETLKRLVSAGPDPFRELADNYTRLSDEYTTEVLRLREELALAGHRGEWPHRGSDCFLMNCRDLYADLVEMQRRVIHEEALDDAD